MPVPDSWLALVIGNSRLHWAEFQGDRLRQTWNAAHLSPNHTALDGLRRLPGAWATLQPPLWIASAVPDQAQRWKLYPRANFIQLEHIPLANLYATLGIDRALALWSTVTTLHSPALVIDAGTALTFTGCNRSLALVGGAILPGLGLQLRSLAQQTAALPPVPARVLTALPPRWATTTPDAISSGVLYSLVATLRDFIQNWLAQFPDSAIALTGGDCSLLFQGLQQTDGAIASQVVVDPDLIFRGIPQLVLPLQP